MSDDPFSARRRSRRRRRAAANAPRGRRLELVTDSWIGEVAELVVFSRERAARLTACRQRLRAGWIVTGDRCGPSSPDRASAMVDQLGIRRRAGRRPRRGPGRTGDPIAEDRRHAPSDARSALAIVHARYDRELTRAATGDPAARARRGSSARERRRRAPPPGHRTARRSDHTPRPGRASRTRPPRSVMPYLHERVSV